jgi:predicted AAA+ superfamily ATPase
MPAVFVPRLLDRSGFDDPRKAKLIVGPRQSGKSTLVWSLIRQRDPATILYLNCEEALVRAWAASPAGMLRDLESDFPTAGTLFFDEVQHLADAGLVVKGLVDARRGLDILVTGSSSFHLADRVRESLAGRAERRVLLPFSLRELLDHEPSQVPAVRRQRAARMAERIMTTGGYPGVWFAADPARELKDLVEAVVLRDASDLFRIRRPDAFRRLLQLAAGQVGRMANCSEWASHLGVSSPTAREYLAIMEQSWIIRLVPSFSAGKRRETTSALRVQFVDTGLRNAVTGTLMADPDRRPDRGALAEGFAFGEILKTLPRDWSIHHWRSKGGAEVDFVLVREGRLIGVEVKAGTGKGGTRRLSRSARSFIDAYAPEVFIVVTGISAPAEDSADGASTEKREAGTRVRRVALADLAQAVLEAASGS